MGRRITSVRAIALAVAFFSCGWMSFSGAAQIVGDLYILAVYGPSAFFREHLHVVRSKPVLILSNGDHVDRALNFVIFVVMLPKLFTLFAVGIVAIRKLTKLMRREVFLLSEFSRLPTEIVPPRDKVQWRDVGFAATIFGLTALIVILLRSDTLHIWLRNYVLLIVGMSIVLRILFIGSPEPKVETPPEKPAPRKPRFVWPL